MFFLEFSATDFAEYENKNRVIQLLTLLYIELFKLFSHWGKAYSEFSKSAPIRSYLQILQ